MEFVYTPKMKKFICEQEDAIWNVYLEATGNYIPKFSEYNCCLKVERSWKCFFKQEYSNQRIPFINGYECYISCIVERNGEIFRYDDREGEVDYYELVMSLNVSSITRDCFKLIVRLCEDTEDVVSELNEWLKIIRYEHNVDNN